MKKFLVVVDTQYDFMMPNGALHVPTAEEIIPAASSFLRNLDTTEYTGVLFTFDTHIPSEYYGSAEATQFPIHCIRYTTGWSNVMPLYDVPEGIPVFTLEKNVFNMWEQDRISLNSKNYDSHNDFSIERDLFFEMMKTPTSIGSGIKADVIEVMGVASDYCVKWAVDGLVKRGFKVEVIQDLCRGITQPAGAVFDDPEYHQLVELI